MREPRNPFRLRTSEQIETDATFLRLFEPGMLDVLPDNGLWDRAQILRSAPGGGKTSILRLFTPSVLLALHANKGGEEYKELHQRVLRLGALDDTGPALLGVTLSCGGDYATLADIDLDEGRRGRLFFGLLNARILLATLRAALTLKRLSFPSDLRHLRVEASQVAGLSPDLPLPCTGQEVYDWVSIQEEAICEAMDSFGPADATVPPGRDGLAGLSLLRPGNLWIDGEVIAEHAVLLLDDSHFLTREQREQLIRAVINHRGGIGIWVAERFEALSTDELLTEGAIAGRDYGRVVQLERYWRGAKARRFEHLVLNIANRRVRAATGVDIGSFTACLPSAREGNGWDAPIAEAARVAEDRARAIAGTEQRFQQWIDHRERAEGTDWERALSWRTLEILIERERRKKQLAFDWPIAAEELDDRDGANIKGAAELFLAEEFKLPYYFGAARLAAVASSNIEQFLDLAGDEFEEVMSAALIKRTQELRPERQEELLRQAVAARWKELPRGVRHGNEVRAFLAAVGEFARSETFAPTASYAPGVTGIAITMQDCERLRDAKYRAAHPDHGRLADVLAAALAYNLLEPNADQKNKGRYWLVLNLNRSLCVQFGLPLQYGGWREKSLRELCRWLDHGFKPTRRAEGFR